MAKKTEKKLTAWDIVQIARHAERPNITDYIRLMCDDFVELHGDRLFGDDRALIGGFATIGGRKVMLIGHRKGRGVEENIEANFGMASPEGYRKAMRLMRLAEKCSLPVVSFVDTPGAYPGSEAEARGQAEAARSLGLSAGQSMRHVVLPQALKRVLPPLAGQFISLVKDTSLVSVIAITELTKSGREAITTSFSTFEIWFCVAGLYLLLNLPLSQIASRLERRLAHSD